MVIKTIYHFLDSNLIVEVSSKRGVNRKRGGSFGSCSAWEGGKRLTLGKEGFAWGTRNRGKLYRFTIKWTWSKAVVKDFPYTLKVPSIDCFKSIATHISQELAFLWITFMGLDTSVLFLCFGQNEPIQVQLFRLQTARMKIIKFLMSFFKPPDNFSLNIASPFSVMTHNSSVVF